MEYVLLILQPIVLLVLFGIWAWCIADALREHRPWIWVIVLALVPILPVPFYLLNFKLFGARADGRLDGYLKEERELRDLRRDAEERDLPIAHRQLAEALLRRGQPEEALRSLGRVLDLDAEDVSAQYLAGVALLAVGQPAKALEHLEYVVEQDPGYRRGDGRLSLAYALQGVGENTRARQEIAAAAESYLLPEAIVRHARFLRDEGQHDRARTILAELLARAEEIDPLEIRRHRPWLRQATEELAALQQARRLESPGE